MNNERFQQTIQKIDAANGADPNLIEIEGQKRPLEVVHAERRTAWIQQLVGDSASEALLLAVRAQHIRRWEIPRDTYPQGRTGYLKWRTDLKKFHAETTAEILRAEGYGEAMINRVTNLVMKKGLKQDAEVQALEDALCLVFLESQFSDFAKKEANKIDRIVRKTWRKMSAKGQAFALQLPLTAEDQAVIQKALQGK